MKLRTAAKWLIGLFLVIAMVVILLLFGLNWWAHQRPFSGAAFDHRRWTHHSLDDRDCIRGAMAKDILRAVARPGTPRSDVERQLGPPDQLRGHIARYELGMCSGLQIDYDHLDIEYSNGKVSKAGHSQS